jgi:protein-L-isoaspartate(D-aspartate) O-methyltransferase
VIPNWAAERRGIRGERVLAAMLEIPREEFVPVESRIEACRDEPIHIGYGQTISQPYMTALMAEALELQGTEKVLEVGTGCGYAAAVLGALAARVVTVEIVPGLVQQARANLRRTGRDGNITVVDGDGSLGYQPEAPFDAISVAAGAPDVPPALFEQLKDPGVLVIPVGERGDQELRVFRKRGGSMDYRVATFCRFVPLRGDVGWR